METIEGRLTQKYELLQQQLLERLEQQEKKHEENMELQQWLAQQEKKYEEDRRVTATVNTKRDEAQ